MTVRTFLAFVAGLAMRANGVALLALVLVAGAAHRKRTLVARHELFPIEIQTHRVAADFTHQITQRLVHASRLQAIIHHIYISFRSQTFHAAYSE